MASLVASAPVASQPVVSAPAEENVMVIDPAARFGLQRTVAMLGDAGVFIDDDARGAILVAKRANHALWGDFSKEGLSAELLGRITSMQQTYRKAIADTPHNQYEQLVNSGKLNQLLVEYVNIQLERSREKLARLKEGTLKGPDEINPAGLLQAIDKEEKKLHGLMGELATYDRSPDYTKMMLKRVEKLVRLDRYMPLGKLVIHSGLVKNATPEVAADLVNDVMGISAARHVKMLADRFNCVKALDATRCSVVAMAERQMTQPLASLFAFEQENPRLDAITALRTLLSAQLNHAFSQENLTPPQQIALEKAAQKLSNEFTQVAMSLAFHYLNEGPAVNDARVKILRQNFKNEMDKCGIELVSNECIMDRTRKLARDSAQDLMIAANGDEKLTAIITSLAKAAGDPVERVPLAAKSQLIGVVIDDPANFTTLLTPRYLEALKTGEAAALNKNSYYYAGMTPGRN